MPTYKFSEIDNAITIHIHHVVELRGLLLETKKAFEARGIKLKEAMEAKDQKAVEALRVDLSSANLQEMDFEGFMMLKVM